MEGNLKTTSDSLRQFHGQIRLANLSKSILAFDRLPKSFPWLERMKKRGKEFEQFR